MLAKVQEGDDSDTDDELPALEDLVPGVQEPTVIDLASSDDEVSALTSLGVMPVRGLLAVGLQDQSTPDAHAGHSARFERKRIRFHCCHLT
jgi:hypothetical protein